jgi:hypothetical protein
MARPELRDDGPIDGPLGDDEPVEVEHRPIVRGAE